MRHALKLTIVLLLLADVCMAETSWDKMLRSYSTAKSYAMDISVNFRITGEANPINYKGSVKQSGANYYSSIQGITTVYGPDYWIIAYDANKTLYYGKSNPDVQKSMFMNQQAFADSLLKLSVKPRLKSTASGNDVYVYDMKDGLYTSVEYTVESATGHLTRVVYFYRPSDDVSYEQITVDYSAISINADVADSWFAAKTYFTIKRGTASGVGRFTGYKLVDQDASIPTR